MLNLPPEDQLRALLKLIYFATVEARGEAWQGENELEGASKERFTKIARLMDAIHNIPGHLISYDSWDQHYFELCLGSKETEIGSWLHKVYSNALQDAKKQDGEQGAPSNGG
jgi:hypothetical protein